MTKRTINFQEDVSGYSTVTSRFSVPKKGVITGLNPHFYEGQEFDLQLEVYVVKSDSERWVNVIPTPSDASGEWIGGNDTHPSLNVRQEVEAGDEILVRWTNTVSYDYTGDVQVTVDYDGLWESLTEVLN
jgi:hypothetical protein